MSEQPLLLDTHAWIWAIQGDRAITTTLRHRINSALKKNRALVATISIWEVGMLWKKERLQIREPILDWIHEALNKSGFSPVLMTEEIALEASLLPGDFHNDPADCLIVATARLENAILVTRDSRIIEYGEAGHVDFIAI